MASVLLRLPMCVLDAQKQSFKVRNPPEEHPESVVECHWEQVLTQNLVRPRKAVC
jgi:hypothetical protein